MPHNRVSVVVGDAAGEVDDDSRDEKGVIEMRGEKVVQVVFTSRRII